MTVNAEFWGDMEELREGLYESLLTIGLGNQIAATVELEPEIRPVDTAEQPDVLARRCIPRALVTARTGQTGRDRERPARPPGAGGRRSNWRPAATEVAEPFSGTRDHRSLHGASGDSTV